MFKVRFDQLSEVIKGCSYSQHLEEIGADQALQVFHSYLLETRNNKGIVYLIGNGGSAGIASHFCVDFINACKIPASTLYDSNVLTCVGNDYGYEYIFSKPLETLIKPNDLLVAISSSGMSQNIINAVDVALANKTPVVTFSGFNKENALRDRGDLNFWLNIKDYGLVETGHFFLLHTIVDSWKSHSFLLKNIIDNSSYVDSIKN
ncbi:MAG: SIS domain-containing protein [Chlamydiota bacterium]|jgi:D-sedoheptulose 7-phosphate isomerase